MANWLFAEFNIIMLPLELQESTIVSLSTLTGLDAFQPFQITLTKLASVYVFLNNFELHANHTLLASTINIGDLIGLVTVTFLTCRQAVKVTFLTSRQVVKILFTPIPKN